MPLDTMSTRGRRVERPRDASRRGRRSAARARRPAPRIPLLAPVAPGAPCRRCAESLRLALAARPHLFRTPRAGVCLQDNDIRLKQILKKLTHYITKQILIAHNKHRNDNIKDNDIRFPAGVTALLFHPESKWLFCGLVDGQIKARPPFGWFPSPLRTLRLFFPSGSPAGSCPNLGCTSQVREVRRCGGKQTNKKHPGSKQARKSLMDAVNPEARQTLGLPLPASCLQGRCILGLRTRAYMMCLCVKHTQTQTQTHRHTDTQTHRHTDTDTQTHRHTDTQTHRHADTQTRRHADTQRRACTHCHT